jgi:hypothetical protein
MVEVSTIAPHWSHNGVDQWTCYDSAGLVIGYWDATNRKLVIPSGAKINVLTGGKIQNNGVDLDLTLALTGSTATAPQVDQLDKTKGIIGGDGLGVLGVAQALFDPSAVAGMRTVAAHALGATIPALALVVGGFVHVHTAFTSANANNGTVAISVEGADDIVAAAAVSGAPYSTIGRKAIVPKANTPESTSVQATIARAITATVGTSALTAGKLTVFLFYVQSLAQA